MSYLRYAIFFPEKDGYLFCGPLGTGTEGTTSVVRSIVDNQDYVRKKTKATSASSSHRGGIYCAERTYYRPHRRIPRLVHSEDFHVLDPHHPRVNDFKSTSMIFEYCNGGPLERFLAILERERILAPEVLVWHLLDNLFEAIEHLHRGNPSIAHGDLHEANIYLHFPTPESRLPELFVGDLGMARPVDESVWEVSGTPPTRWLRDINVITQEDVDAHRDYWAMRASGVAPQDLPPSPKKRTKPLDGMINDVKSIHSTLFRLLQGNAQPPNNMIYAPFAGWQLIDQIMRTDPNDYNAFVAHHPAVRAIAQQARDSLAVLPDFQWTRQHRYRDDLPAGVTPMPPFPWTRYNHHLVNHPFLKRRLARPWRYNPQVPEIWLFHARDQILNISKHIPGPWQIARVHKDTLQVLAVERLSFNLHVPAITDNCPVSRSGRPFNRDDHLMLNQLVQPFVDHFGIANIVATAQGRINGHLNNELFGRDPAWPDERIAKQGQLALRASAPVPVPHAPVPAPPPPPTLAAATLAQEDTVAEAQAQPETEQANTALPQKTPSPQRQASPTPPPAAQPPPPQRQGSPVIKQESPTVSNQPPPAAQPAAGASPARENTPAQESEDEQADQAAPALPAVPAAPVVPAVAAVPGNRVTKKTKDGRKGAKGKGKGKSAATRNPPARTHPAARPRAARPAPPPSRVTTRSMARKEVMDKIIWTRSRTRAAAAAAAAKK